MSCNVCLHEKVCPHLTNKDAERCKQFANKDEYIKVGKYKNKYSVNSTGKTVGQIIHEKREELCLSQFEFALKIGTSQSAIYCWENNVKTPSLKNAIKLACVFNCSLDELCGREVKINE